jgi:signal transduction histidine kinase/CheY-like chemotaxis protein
MKIPWSTIGGLLQGIMAGVVIFFAIFAVLLISRVGELRERLEVRVDLIASLQALDEEMDRILSSLDAKERPEGREWTRRALEVERSIAALLRDDSLDDALSQQILLLKEDLTVFGSRLGVRSTTRDALRHRGQDLRDGLHGAIARTRDSTAGLSRELGKEWQALYAVTYAALGLCLAVLILLVVSRGHSRRLEALRADLHLARDDLEERVRERTTELMDSNRRLREEVGQRREAQREAERIQGELVQAQKMESLGKLAGGVAHDFNNLMASIRGNSELLLRRLDASDPRRRYGEDVVQATLRAETLTLQLLAFSRHQPYDPRPVDLAALVRGFRTLLTPLLREDVILESALEDATYVIHADPNQVEQILLNLAVNARDAMPKGGLIRISALRLQLDASSPELHPDVEPGTYIRLTIEDDGTGIPPEIQPRIFEPFFSTKGPGEGSGLGLSVVYGIVRRHGGWVDVESVVGSGTAFHVHLPATDEAPVALPAAPSEEEIPARAGERILVVEDEDAVRELAREILFEQGFEVECAASLGEARAAVEAAPGFDLLFTDMALPDGDGLNLATELQGTHPELRVLLTSGYVDHLARWPLIRERGYRLLRKPYLISALQTAVREVLDA